MSVVQQIFDARWICNGFPKSGTHLLVQMVNPVARYNPGTEAGLFKKPWTGTFAHNSWTNERVSLEQTCFKAGRILPGHMLKAHLGHSEELERFLYLLGVVHVFIYRDLRDVAVSQAYHILNSDDERLAHPEPELYRGLGGFGEVLSAVIGGLGRYPGVLARWRHYAPWLDVNWVLSVRYEDLRADPEAWAERIFCHGMNRSAATWNREVGFEESGLRAVINVMVKASTLREKSPTFRKGNVGDWRDEFGPGHVRLFKETDGDGWLVRLGYEESGDWDV